MSELVETQSVELVPVIDLSEPIEQVGKAIDEACRRIGFFQVVGHGIDATVEDAMWAAATAFFDLPLATKRSIAIQPGEAYGYAGFGTERLAASLGDDTPPDLKETFSVGPFHRPDRTADDPALAFVFSPNRWPDAPPEFEEICARYYRAMSDLAARILSAMAIGLRLDAGFFTTSIDRHASALRLLHYPELGATRPQPGQLRAGAHADYGTLTLLRQDDTPGGLEVRHRDGGWAAVPAIAGAYVVNVGDALERWSNDRWRSTLHRVVVPPASPGDDCTRQSIAFFHNANWDAELACLPNCCDDDNPPRYEPVTAGRHLMERFLSTQSE